MSVQFVFNSSTINNNDFEWKETDLTNENDSWVSFLPKSGVMDYHIPGNTLTEGNMCNLSNRNILLFALTNMKDSNGNYTNTYAELDETNANMQIAVFDTNTNDVVVFRPTLEFFKISFDTILTDEPQPEPEPELESQGEIYPLTLKLLRTTGGIENAQDGVSGNYESTIVNLVGSNELSNNYKLMSVQLAFNQTSVNNNEYKWVNTDISNDTEDWVSEIDNNGSLGDKKYISNTLISGNKCSLSNRTISLFRVTNPYNWQSSTGSYMGTGHGVVIDELNPQNQIVLFNTSNNNILTYSPTFSNELKLAIEYEN